MPNSKFINNSHNISNLVYYFACPIKYHRIVFDEKVDKTLRQIYERVELRYDWIRFLEIGDRSRTRTFSNSGYS